MGLRSMVRSLVWVWCAAGVATSCGPEDFPELAQGAETSALGYPIQDKAATGAVSFA
jgi:hypothetical protein